ncbi:MAG: YtxH domain-containing protein [Bacteroides sp.]|nr:YtxH domain-containing protein [Bacteroides sp.]
MFAGFVLTLVVSFTSCRDRKEQNRSQHQVEKIKKDINDAADKVSDKVQNGAEAVDVKDSVEKTGKEIKKGYSDTPKRGK